MWLRLSIHLAVLGSALILATSCKHRAAQAPAVAGAQVQDDAANNQQTQQAIEKCHHRLGFAKEDFSTARASMVTIEDDNTPYMRDEVNGRLLWQVIIPARSHQKKAQARSTTSVTSRDWKILLDPVSEIVMKVKSKLPAGEPEMRRSASSVVAAQQMHSISRETYHGFPARPPKISFQDALSAIETRGFSTAIAKQIIVDCILWSKHDWQPRPVWAVTLRGVPSISPRPPDDYLDQIRHIVDAQTGKWIEALNIPRFESSYWPP